MGHIHSSYNKTRSKAFYLAFFVGPHPAYVLHTAQPATELSVSSILYGRHDRN